ncbi:MAG: RHS repeat-associated core domain-containing protein [Nibricoccus sp.]
MFIGGIVNGTAPQMEIALGTDGAVLSEQTISGTTFLLPDKVYPLTVTSSGVTSATINLLAPVGYQVYINGVERKQLQLVSVPATDIYDVEIKSQGSGGIPGTSSPVLIGGDVAWGVALGRLFNGALAGSLVVRSQDLSAALFDRAVLSFNGTSRQVFVYRDTAGKVRQIVAPEVFVDIYDISDGFVIDMYPLSAGGSPEPGGYRPIVDSAAKYVSYQVKKGAGTTGLDVVCTRGTLTTTTEVEQTGGSWTKSLEGDLAVEERVETTNANGDRVELITLKDGNNVVARKIRRVFHVFPWNSLPDFPLADELIEETADPDGASPASTIYTYYDQAAQYGNYSQVSSIVYPGGNWVKYEYYDDYNRFGRVKREYHPWKDGPATPGEATTANCRVIEYNYTLDWDGVYSIPSSIEEKVLGVTVSKTTATASVNQSVNGLKLWTSTKTVHAGASDAVTTITKAYQRNQDEANSLYNGLTYSVTNPDQTRTSYVHQVGTYNESTDTFLIDPSGTAMREIALQGTTNASIGTPYNLMEGATIDDIRLVDKRSTKTVSIRKNGRLLRTEVQIFSGSGFETAGWTKYAYTDSGRLRRREASTGAVYQADWANEFCTKEILETGVELSYSPDLIQRVKTVVKAGAPDYSSYAAQVPITTTYTYNAAGNRTATTVTGGGFTLTESASFDHAGRLLSSKGSDGAETIYAYDLINRTITTNFPTGGTRILTCYLDGRSESVTGTGQPSEYIDYTYGIDGLTTTTHVGSSTSGAWSSVKKDWLGRTTRQSAPGSQANQEIQQAYFYNSSGQLEKSTSTGLSPTLYVYDIIGVLSLSGLDADGDGQLMPSSTDRITKTQSDFVKVGGDWWSRERSYVYPKANDGTEILVAETKTRLSGFPVGIFAEQQLNDQHGNTTIQKTQVDPAHKMVTQLTDVPGSTLDAKQISYNGLLVETDDSQGGKVTMLYDGVGRLSRTVDPRKGVHEVLYETNRNLVAQTRFLNGPVIAKYNYDAAARLTRTEDALGAFTRQSYDAQGHLYRVWGSGASPVEYVYDDFGRLEEQATFRGGTGWASENEPAGASGFGGTADRTTFQYYGDTGFREKRTDAANKYIRYQYDSAGRLRTQTQARLFNGNAVTITLGYDSATGEITGKTYSDTTPAISYTYSRSGAVKTVTDVTGMRTFQYDTATGLMLNSEDLPDYFGANRRLQYSYDFSTNAPLKGRLSGYSFGTTTTTEQSLSQTFKIDGRLDGVEVAPSGQAHRTFTYGYHAAQPALITSLSESTTGYAQTRAYSSRWDIVESITTVVGASTKAAYAYTFDNRGQRKTSLQSGETFADYGDSTYFRYNYDDRGQVTTAAAYLGSNVALENQLLPGRHFEYGYDAIGNRTAANHTGVTDLKENYTPNALNQITSRENKAVHVSGTGVTGMKVRVGGGAVPAATAYQGQFWSTDVQLNNAGGPAKATLEVYAGKAGAGAGGVDLLGFGTEFNRTVFLPSATEALSYDDDGNLQSDGRWLYTYDAENRLIRLENHAALLPLLSGVPGGEQPTAVEFKYDYQGRRVSKKVYNRTGGTWSLSSERRYVYQGWNVIAELNGSGSTLRQFFWNSDVLLMIQDGSETYLPGYDGNGNLTTLMKANGVIAAAYEYSPYGELLRAEGSYATQNPFRWSGQWTDDESSLVCYGLRYYNPGAGRFINRDPIGEAGGINLYAFVANNPVNTRDILGASPPWRPQPPGLEYVAPDGSWLPDGSPASQYNINNWDVRYGGEFSSNGYGLRPQMQFVWGVDYSSRYLSNGIGLMSLLLGYHVAGEGSNSVVVDTIRGGNSGWRNAMYEDDDKNWHEIPGTASAVNNAISGAIVGAGVSINSTDGLFNPQNGSLSLPASLSVADGSNGLIIQKIVRTHSVVDANGKPMQSFDKKVNGSTAITYYEAWQVINGKIGIMVNGKFYPTANDTFTFAGWPKGVANGTERATGTMVFIPGAVLTPEYRQDTNPQTGWWAGNLPYTTPDAPQAWNATGGVVRQVTVTFDPNTQTWSYDSKAGRHP